MSGGASQSSQKQHNLITAVAFVPHKSVFVHVAPVAVMTVIVLVSALTTHHAEARAALSRLHLHA